MSNKKHQLVKLFIYIALALIAFVLAILPITAYSWNFYFRHFYFRHMWANFDQYVSSDPADWGVFGDFIGGITNPILSFINILVVIWLALKVYELESSRENNNKKAEALRQRRVNTFEMMKEWDSFSMRESRNKSWKKYVVDQDKKEIPEQAMIAYSEIDFEETVNIARVLEFFDRLDFMVDNKMIEKEEAKKYFERDYTTWEKFYIEKQRRKSENNSYNSVIKEEPYEWLFSQEIYNNLPKRQNNSYNYGLAKITDTNTSFVQAIFRCLKNLNVISNW